MSRPGLAPEPALSPARPAGSFPFAFGPRFFVGMAAGLLWLLPAWADRRFLAAALLWDLGLLLFWGFDLSRIPPPRRITVRRSWGSAPSLGRESLVEIEIANGGTSDLVASVADEGSPGIFAGAATLKIEAPAGRAGRASYTIRPTTRGDAVMGSIYLRLRSRLALAERRARADLAQTVRVYPDLEGARSHLMHLVHARPVEREKRLARRHGMGREFESLREYREGDAWRDVCWTASARRGKLISKVYRNERSQAVWILVDSGRLLRAPAAGLAKIDHAVNAALALAQVAMHSGDRVGLLTYGRRPQLRASAARGSAHLRSLLERLASVEAEPLEADHTGAAHALLLSQKQRSLVVWLTDFAETATLPPVVEPAVRIARTHLVLLAAIGQPDLADAIAREPEDASSMYRHVAALEVAYRRDLLLRELRSRGVLAMEVEPGALPAALIDHYLQVKDRGLI